MMIRAFFFLLLSSVIATFANAATRYANPTDQGNSPCTTEGTPCSLDEAITAAVCGDTIQLDPGTYTGTTITVTGRPCTAGSPMTVQADNYYVNCTDPDNDPDGCTTNTSNVSFIQRSWDVLSGSHYWKFVGVGFRDFAVSSSDNGSFRFGYGNGALDPGGATTVSITGTSNWTVEHSYFTNLDPDGHDYAIRAFWDTNLTLRNLYISGNYNHNISLKNGNRNVTIERIVCEGFHSECIVIGQEQDANDSGFNSRSPTSCPSTLIDNGTTANITDQTAQFVTINSVFARDVTNADYATRVGLWIDNARDVTVTNLFAKSGLRTPLEIFNIGTATFPGGRCGIERGNISIRGAILIATDAANGCVLIASMGESPATVALENIVCHDAVTGSDPGITWGGVQMNHAPAWETTQRPSMTIRNSIWNDCTTAWSDSTNTISFAQSHNDFFNCGTSKGGTGAQTVDPQFVGPESITAPTLSASYYATGARLWDWAGTYQPIIDQFDTQTAALVDGGTGTASPCTGAACDIGANEFFFALPPGVWSSCAAVANGESVHAGAATPWISGLGLVVDIDCAAKQIVIGACTDPLDAGTCDTSLYVFKAAYLQKKRVQAAITLDAGTATSDADTSGSCWRTRATYTFTDTLEEVTGIWVIVERDGDGGTHDCTANQPSPLWSWQAHE